MVDSKFIPRFFWLWTHALPANDCFHHSCIDIKWKFPIRDLDPNNKSQTGRGIHKKPGSWITLVSNQQCLSCYCAQGLPPNKQWSLKANGFSSSLIIHFIPSSFICIPFTEPWGGDSQKRMKWSCSQAGAGKGRRHMQMANVLRHSGGWAQSEGDWNGKQKCHWSRSGVAIKGLFGALEEVTDIH